MITEMMNQDVYFAKLARVVGRFEDMREYMEKIAREAASEQNELTTEEHELLSGTYENVIGSRLAVLKNISSMIKEEQGIARAESGPGNPIRLNLALNFSMFYIEALCSPEMACTIYYQEGIQFHRIPNRVIVMKRGPSEVKVKIVEAHILRSGIVGRMGLHYRSNMAGRTTFHGKPVTTAYDNAIADMIA
ncbi:hypothetical protein ZIOFF_023545 [Zingiber officinale]|uniref:14-3-3 domain-containing protein n=1 Tax=Zingiber officinale TaxID=94328 RepID=A0A8J5GQT2_ZINOF|nr:hypothetical protein ZIOFF_023545 [Zingiber officinale]